MSRWRKKPVVVEAEQFVNRLVSGVPLHIPEGVVRLADGNFVISTLEGPHIVTDGDWIITGIKGEKYPCKPDIFEATYEPEKPTIRSSKEFP